MSLSAPGMDSHRETQKPISKEVQRQPPFIPQSPSELAHASDDRVSGFQRETNKVKPRDIQEAMAAFGPSTTQVKLKQNTTAKYKPEKNAGFGGSEQAPMTQEERTKLEEIGGETSGFFADYDLQTLRENEGNVSKEDLKEGRARGRKQDIIEEGQKGLDVVAEDGTSSEKEKDQKKERTERAVKRWASEKDETGMTGFFTVYREAKEEEKRGNPKKMQALRKTLLADGMTEEDIKSLYKLASDDEYVDEHLGKVKEANLDVAVIEKDIRDGTNNAVDLANEREANKEKYGEEKAREIFKERIGELAKGDRELQKTLEFYEKQDKANAAYKVALGISIGPRRSPSFAAFEEAGLSSAGAEAADDFSEDAKEELLAVAKNGGSELVDDFLTKGELEETDLGLVGSSSSDAGVRINEAKISITGEHASDPKFMPVSQPYPVDPPSINNFNTVHRDMIVTENGIHTLAQPGLQVALAEIAEGITEEEQDKGKLMSPDAANRLHNFVVLLFGDVESHEEEKRLRETGIISQDDGFAVNHRRVDQMKDALSQYTPRRLDERMIHEGMQIDYDMFRTLALMWDVSGNDTKMPTSTELRQLSDMVAISTKPRDVIQQRLDGTDFEDIEVV